MMYEEAIAAMERYGKPRTPDLIERGYLLFRINDDPLGYNMDDFDKLYGIILNAPTIDAAVVQHGHWYDGDSRKVTARCSVCGRLRLGNGAEWCNEHIPYCEMCGAKMDKEAKDASD